MNKGGRTPANEMGATPDHSDESKNKPQRFLVEDKSSNKRDGSDILLDEQRGTYHHVLATLTNSATEKDFRGATVPLRVVWAVRRKVAGRVQPILVLLKNPD